MGTGFKGNALHYRGIAENIPAASSKYKYHNGRFGENSPSTGNRTRIIASSDPLQTAMDFYNTLAYGGLEKTYEDRSRRITQMADGTIITWRMVSRSDGSPVVEINVSGSSNTGGLKKQKIHFVRG